MRKYLWLLLIFAALPAGCNNNTPDARPKQQPAPAASTESAQTDREKLESEVREGSSLQDPGGAKGLREESSEQMKEQQEQVQDVDNQ